MTVPRLPEISALGQDAVGHLDEYGYAVVRGLLDVRTDLAPLSEEYTALLDALANRWHAGGILGSTYSDLSFEHRFARILADIDTPIMPYFDICLAKSGITAETPMHDGPSVFHLITSARLLDAVELFLGPEIYSNPIQHVRIKPPERLVPRTQRNALTAATPWHQDMGVAMPEADDSDVLTVWIPVSHATPENGCLALVPRSHKGDLLPHCRSVPGTKIKTAPHIRQELIDAEEVVPIAMRPGDVLFMHKRTIHGSLPNLSDQVRWSFDLRYNPIGQATGRPEFPGFVARSRQCPERELTDAAAWSALWSETRRRLDGREGASFFRWSLDDPLCA